jgi:hypothetical protein
MLTIRDIKAGDIVELDCPKLLQNTKHESKVITGVVDHVFDALHPDGSEGNLEIDIRYDYKWLRYKPLVDGGTITILKGNK